MNLAHDFVEVWNLLKTKKIKQMEHFFSPNLHAQIYTHSNYWGDADVDHSQTIEGDTAKLLGGYIPHPPLFRHP